MGQKRATWANFARPEEEAIRQNENSRLGHVVDGLGRSHWIGTFIEVAEKLVRLKRDGLSHVVTIHTPTDTFAEINEQMQRFAEEVMPVLNAAQ